jgi:hypothetical protein
VSPPGVQRVGGGEGKYNEGTRKYIKGTVARDDCFAIFPSLLGCKESI